MAQIIKVRLNYEPNRDEWGNDKGHYIDKDEMLPVTARYLSCKTQYNPFALGDYELHIGIYFFVEQMPQDETHLYQHSPFFGRTHTLCNVVEEKYGSSVITYKDQENTVQHEVPTDCLRPVMGLNQFRVIGTGERFDLRPGERFLNTIKRNEGEHMWHVFWTPPKGYDETLRVKV